MIFILIVVAVLLFSYIAVRTDVWEMVLALFVLGGIFSWLLFITVSESPPNVLGETRESLLVEVKDGVYVVGDGDDFNFTVEQDDGDLVAFAVSKSNVAVVEDDSTPVVSQQDAGNLKWWAFPWYIAGADQYVLTVPEDGIQENY